MVGECQKMAENLVVKQSKVLPFGTAEWRL